MKEQHKQEVRQIAEQVVEVTMRRLGKIPGLIGGHIFTVEADRLTAPAEDSSPEAQFEGVKYVVAAEVPDVAWQIATREDFLSCWPDKVDVADEPGAIFGRLAERVGYVAHLGRLMLSPWHPKKRELVRLEAKPELVGRVSHLVGGEPEYMVRWEEEDGDPWQACYPASDLRPHEFPPEHTKAEPESEGGKAEFEEGELVSTDDGALGVVSSNRTLALTNLNGADWVERPLRRSLHLATDAEIEVWVGRASAPWENRVIARALRDHFRSEAQKGAGR